MNQKNSVASSWTLTLIVNAMKAGLVWMIVVGTMLTALHVRGQVWEEVTLPGQFAQGYYLDVFFLPSNPQYGWACGFSGFVVRTTNGGQTWQGSVVPYNGRAGGHLESIHFVDAFNGYTSGPCGVFRTTDGGATWTDITPPFPSEGPWGCYFLSATTGVVLGGGCAGPQNFFRTTNGGASWTLFQANLNASGLTDAILYPNGSGFAVSSGILWQTSDGGATWSILTSTGPNYWNEELTRSGNSFLIPWAGSNCSGQGSGGGGRFSTDGGQTWRSYSTGVPMFGAFLHDSQRGWICGYARQVWYTTDAGQSWQYRGCGTRGDLDDLWMIDDTTGFVVGQGIYRYARAQRTASKTLVDFGAHCPPVLRLDTLYLRNRSWNATSVRLSLSGQHASAFAVVQPASAQTIGVPSCDSLMVVVRYQPSTDGVHTAALSAEFSSGETLVVQLRGERIGNAVTVQDTLVEVTGVPAGEAVTLSLGLQNRSTLSGQVVSVTRLSGATFMVDGALPLAIPPGGNTLRFRFVPPDTGWFVSRVRIRTEPCSRDTVVTLRVYARSPIISATALTFNSPCGEGVQDSVLITNTGNSDLVISALWIEPLGVPIQVIGSSRGSLPIVTPPSESTWVHLRYEGYGSGTASLVLEHNDQTLVRPITRPLRVPLSYGSAPPSWTSSPRVLDFGTLCVGESHILFAEIVNTGTVPLALTARADAPFAIAANRQFSLAPRTRQQIGVSFTPVQAGRWSSALVLAIEPCSRADTILLQGHAETTLLAVEPQPVVVRVQVGESRRIPVVVRSTGSAYARISQIELTPVLTQWRLRTPPLPLTLQPGRGDTIWLDVEAGDTPTQLTGRLCVDADTLCPVQACVEVRCIVEPREFHDLQLSPLQHVFAFQRCTPRRERRTVTIANNGTFVETVTAARIEPAGAPFAIVSPVLPFSIRPGEQVEIGIEYAPVEEGIHQATLVLESPAAWSTPRQVELVGSFGRVITQCSPERTSFGTLATCSAVQELPVRFFSRGMLSDTLVLVAVPERPGWSVPASAQVVAIAPNDSAEVVLRFDPSAGEVGGAWVDQFVWESRVCPLQLRVEVAYQVVRPQLSYSPAEIDLGRLMQHSTVRAQVEIGVLPPVEEFTVVSWELTTIAGAADLQLDAPLPFATKVPQRALIAYTVTPRQVGPYRAQVRFAVVSRLGSAQCHDTIVVMLTGNVEEEHYWGRLSMHRHTGLVGDTIRVPVVLSTRDSSADALWRAMPAAIGFVVRYDAFVLDAVGAVAGSGGVELPTVRELGLLQVRVPRESRVGMLGSSDTLATLVFVGLQSPPLRSELHFTRSWAETLKPYTIEHDDGEVVLDACVPWARFVLSSEVHLRVVPNPADDAHPPTLEVVADSTTTLECALYRNDGRQVAQWTLHVEKGHYWHLLPCEGSGVYFLRVSQRNGVSRWVFPLVVR